MVEAGTGLGLEGRCVRLAKADRHRCSVLKEPWVFGEQQVFQCACSSMLCMWEFLRLLHACGFCTSECEKYLTPVCSALLSSTPFPTQSPCALEAGA